MKIVFLDIDGVLNSVQYDRLRTAEQGNIDETRLPLLRRLIDESNAVIVLSSSWRKHWDKNNSLCDSVGKEIVGLFARYGISVYDKTPYLQSNDRAEEIRTWLSKNGNVDAFVILDDIAFGWGTDLQDKLVKTDPRIGRGLESNHIRKAIEILKSK